MRAFVTVWFGQSASMVGSRLTTFALGVWAYQRSGSVTQFAALTLCASFFEMAGLTISGSIVDRRTPRAVMMAADVAGALASLTLAALYVFDHLALVHVCAAVAVNATAMAFQGPAFNSATSLLVGKERLGRAFGMVRVSQAVALISAPVLATLVLAKIGLGWIFVLDVASFVIALGTQTVIGIPRSTAPSEARPPFFQDLALGWRFIFQRRNLVGLLAFMTVVSFLQAMAEVLFTPMILKQSSMTQLGTTMSTIGVGVLCGSLLAAAWGGPKQQLVRGIVGFTLIQALALVGAGLRPNLLLITACATTTMFFAPIISTINATLWQRKSPQSMQGRVYAARFMIALAVEPLGQLCAGPLADRLFEPAMAKGGALAVIMGPVFGVGSGRGMGLLMSLLGGCALLLVIVGLAYRPLRDLERDVPDAPEDETPAAGEAATTRLPSAVLVDEGQQ
jgi:MFS transporter, DHA3 family, macrolide efflux protein